MGAPAASLLGARLAASSPPALVWSGFSRRTETRRVVATAVSPLASAGSGASCEGASLLRSRRLLRPLPKLWRPYPRSFSVCAAMASSSTSPPISEHNGVKFLELGTEGLANRKAAISEIETRPMDGPSRFVRPQCIHFTHYGKRRRWDMVAAHPSVAILVYHKGHDAILMVRQFRPPAYISECMAKAAQEGNLLSSSSMSPSQVAALGVPLEVAFTYELCAGLVDKEGKSLAQVAKEEVLEETGYDVPVASLRHLATALSGVGMSGAKQTLFYTEVEESQRATAGGGNDHEGEAIDLVGLPVDQIDSFIASHDLPKAPGALFALMWFKGQRS